MRPAPSKPGMDRVRPILGTVKLVDLDRACIPDKGEVVRGRYGRDMEALTHEGELGEEGSVDLRTYGGLRAGSELLMMSGAGCCKRGVGKGEERNSSILSVSGTGSIVSVSGGGGRVRNFRVRETRIETL